MIYYECFSIHKSICDIKFNVLLKIVAAYVIKLPKSDNNKSLFP